MDGLVSQFSQDGETGGFLFRQIVFRREPADPGHLGMVGGVFFLVVLEHQFHDFFSQETEFEHAGIGIGVQILFRLFSQFCQQGKMFP